MPIPAGNIVEIKDKDRIVCGVVLAPGEKQLHVLAAGGRDFKIPVEKILFSGPELALSKGKDFLSSSLLSIQEKREMVKGEIQLSLLWEAVGESEEPRSAEELARLYFGEECTPDQIAGMIRALHSDWGYFRPRGSGFFPLDAHAVAVMEAGRKQQALHKEQEEAFVSWLLSGGESALPAGGERFVEVLRDYLIFVEQTPKLKQAQELMRRGKVADRDQLSEILARSGFISENENFFLKRYKVPGEFPAKVMEEALQVLGSDVPVSDRLDLTPISAITVDDEATTDIDDALSLELFPDGFRVGVHIADVSEWVLKDSLLDKEAHARSTSIYLPDEKITMLPPAIIEAASLKRGEVRPALSVLATFRENGNLVSWEIKETLVKVTERLTYDEVDRMMGQDATLSKLHKFALQLQEERKKNGALVVQFPKIEICVDGATGEIVIKHPQPRSRSQVMVSEWMILANKLAAGFAFQNQIPVLYRAQQAAGKIFPLADGDWVMLFRQRRCIRKGEVAVQPSPHHGLGLSVYLQMTSPIRRYSDLVIHRQLKAFLHKTRLPYGEEELETIRAYSERWVEIAELAEREWKKYWLLKYLSRKVGSKLDAVVLESSLNDYLLFIPEFALEVNSPRGIKGFSEGDVLQVSIEMVKPREGLIKVIPC